MAEAAPDGATHSPNLKWDMKYLPAAYRKPPTNTSLSHIPPTSHAETL